MFGLALKANPSEYKLLSLCVLALHSSGQQWSWTSSQKLVRYLSVLGEIFTHDFRRCVPSYCRSSVKEAGCQRGGKDWMPKGKEAIRSVRLSLRASRTRGKAQVKTEILCCRNPDSPVGTDRKKTTKLEASKCLAFHVEFWASVAFSFEERRICSVGKEVKVYLKKNNENWEKKKTQLPWWGLRRAGDLAFLCPKSSPLDYCHIWVTSRPGHSAWTNGAPAVLEGTEKGSENKMLGLIQANTLLRNRTVWSLVTLMLF